ncbi:thiol:disulfide interchange protein DsbG [Acidovorax sp. MR-S7]|uniref:thiol:disulfide interchange protein DsbG n=1 Tax=Acidovorax sp. MR-S7 TaxID=1268622 RepID=UPI00037A552E|nr:thiol:disulfide interchange protein DsbG [Acidovorax sp. MR-S7]GAD24653.1 protein-disulfide isomerase [Acidovorax sp. MR-S7]
MFPQRSRFSFAAASFMLLATVSQAQAADYPPAVKALEKQGLTVMQEFKVGGGLRAFAAVAGDRPIAVYVTSDGNAILGTRLDSKGEPLDEASLEKLAAKPISDKTWARLESSKWVRDGKADAPRVVYTFSDANCPYCHRFWEAARPWVDAGKVQLRHIMVGIIKEDSPTKAAAILGASDPAAALLENERNFDKGGIKSAKSVPADVRKILDEHQVLMLETGFRGTPGIVVREGDVLKKYNGMPQGTAMNEVLGPR